MDDGQSPAFPDVAVSLPDFSQLVDAIYRGATEDGAWHLFLEQLARLLPCDHAGFILRQPVGSRREHVIAAGGGSDALLRRIAVQEAGQDYLVNAPRRFSSEGSDGGVMRIGRFVVADMIGLDLRDESSWMFMRLRLIRKRGGGRFDARAVALLAALRPHIHRAFELFSTVSRQTYALEDYRQTAEQLAVTILILARDLRIIHRNGAVDAIFGEGAGFGVDAHGRLYCRYRRGQEQLRRLVAQTLNGRVSARLHDRVILLQREDEMGRWSIFCRRMHDPLVATEKHEPSVKLFIRFVPATKTVTAQAVRDVLPVTPKQACLVAGLVNGQDLSTVTREIGIARNTGRVHLAAVYARAGVRSQSSLVSLVLRQIENGWY
jgi:hypothetical protein